MTKKKTTKEIRAIDRIIKFQIDDGIESLTIAGKEALADLEIDRKNNVTLYVNADKDKVNEINSLVPFINVAVKENGQDPNKKKAVTLSQDLTQFALELAEDSKQLAEIIKTETSITLDFAQLITRLNDLRTAVDNADRTATQALTKAEHAEQVAQENASKTAELESKNTQQDSKLIELGARVDTHEISLNSLGRQISNQKSDITELRTKQAEQDSKLASVDLTPLEQRIANAESMASGLGMQIASIEQVTGGLSIKDTELENRVTTLENGSSGNNTQLYNIIYGSMSDSVDYLPNFIIQTDIPTNKTIEITIHTNEGSDSALISNGVILENNLKRFTLNSVTNTYQFDAIWKDNQGYTGDVTVFVRIYEFKPVEHYHPNIYKAGVLD